MFCWILVSLVCMVIGCVTNFVSINMLFAACELYGADAIGMFFFGLIGIIISLVSFVLFTICGKQIFNDWKGE